MLHTLAASIPELDIKQFDTCVGQQMSLGAVIRDRDLAARLGVHGTPTVFLNGEQMHGISDAASLHRTLEEALERIQPTAATDKGAAH